MSPEEPADIHEVLDDLVDAWHADEHGMSLETFLGMSWPQYAVWARTPSRLDPGLHGPLRDRWREAKQLEGKP